MARLGVGCHFAEKVVLQVSSLGAGSYSVATPLVMPRVLPHLLLMLELLAL
jgi:hypothetical protein